MAHFAMKTENKAKWPASTVKVAGFCEILSMIHSRIAYSYIVCPITDSVNKCSYIIIDYSICRYFNA